MAIAHEMLRPDARVPARRLIPAAARPGYVPVTDLPWLEALRERHERLAARLADEVLVPDRVHAQHEAAVAEWHREVREAAYRGDEPPEWNARLSDDWLAGLIDAAQAVIAATVGEILAVLRDADAACDEHGLDALIEPVDDGFGGALVAMQRTLAGEGTAAPLPPWAGRVRGWRQWHQQRFDELRSFGRRDGGKVDANPYGGRIRGTTLEEHAAEQRARVSAAQGAVPAAADAGAEYVSETAARAALDEHAAAQIALAKTTTRNG